MLFIVSEKGTFFSIDRPFKNQATASANMETSSSKLLAGGLVITVSDEELAMDTADAWFQEITAREMTVPDVTISLVGFAQETDAQNLGNILRGFLIFFGKLMNLSSLSRVWVSYDYENTLLSLNRGTEIQTKLMPTQDDVAVGIAMTPAVIEDGAVKSVMVFNATYLMALTQPENEEIQPLYKRMLYLVAHECGHVHDLGMKVRSLPDTWLKVRLGRYDEALFEAAEGCWSEYIASRLSAFMSPTELTSDYETTFCDQVEKRLPAIRTSIRQYRMHADLTRVLSECSYVVKKVFLYTGYLLRQLDGCDMSFADSAPKAASLLVLYPELRRIVEETHRELQALYATYGEWTNLGVFAPLKKLVLQLYAWLGLELQDKGEQGMYVNIPMTPDTVPSIAEQIELSGPRRSTNLCSHPSGEKTFSPSSPKRLSFLFLLGAPRFA
jgi:hypothetical protein